MLPANCKVIRDGREQTVPASTLVKGDVVHVQIGDKVPADLRIIWAANAKVINTLFSLYINFFLPLKCKVERSSMTGEAEPEPMTTDCTSERVVETKNLGFSGSLMINGEAYGIVVRVSCQSNSSLCKISVLITFGLLDWRSDTHRQDCRIGLQKIERRSQKRQVVRVIG